MINKKKLKRCLSITLALVLMISSFSLSAFAANETVLSVNAPTTMPKAGETFTVTVSLSGNTGVSAAQFTLGFDKSLMNCSSVNVGDVLKGSMSATNPNAADGVIVAAASVQEMTKDGTVATMTFTATKDISAFNFTLDNIVLANNAGEDLNVSVTGVTESSTAGGSSQGNSGGTSSGSTGGSGSTTSSTQTNNTTTQTTNATTTQTASVGFKDVYAGHWAETWISKAVEMKLFNGYSNGNFGVNDSITRAQFVTVLYRMAGSPAVSASTPFTDTSNLSTEFKNAVAWAYSNGYVNGKSATTFDPEGKLTRQEAMKVLFGYNGNQSGLEVLLGSGYDATFKDASDISSWAKSAMYWAVGNKVIAGTADGRLNPKGVATRAELAKILVCYKNGGQAE